MSVAGFTVAGDVLFCTVAALVTSVVIVVVVVVAAADVVIIVVADAPIDIAILVCSCCCCYSSSFSLLLFLLQFSSSLFLSSFIFSDTLRFCGFAGILKTKYLNKVSITFSICDALHKPQILQNQVLSLKKAEIFPSLNGAMLYEGMSGLKVTQMIRKMIH